jgi:hemoglobin-like flavoprotein
LFRNIFKLAPTALLLFSFKEEPKIYQSEAFKSHALKVMQGIAMAVAGLDDLEKLIPVLKGLGKMHLGKGVKAEHYPVVGEALIMTLKAGMRKAWNDDVENAWKAIF